MNTTANTIKQTITLPLDQLHVSPFNMRAEKKLPSLKAMALIAANILPSVREKGILTNPIVRKNNTGFEILAGRRRFYAALVVKSERGSFAPITCDLIPEGDDAAALEISLIENVARENPDMLSEYETYSGLIALGRTPAEIAKLFGKTEKEVTGRLAIANLHPRIRHLYRTDEDFSADDLQALTMASKKMQIEYLALVAKNSAPTGRSLRAYLLGGEEISTDKALFNMAEYKGELRQDLFGDSNNTFFADSEEFWKSQNAAIAALRDTYLQSGWADVLVLPRGDYYRSWDWVKAKKADGARIVIEVRSNGEVIRHEGYITENEAARAKKKNAGDRKDEKKDEPKNPVTQAMGNYIALHRHSLVRLALIANPAHALKLMVAQAVSASGNWRVSPDAQRADTNEISQSVQKSPAQAAFDAEKKEVAKLLAPAFAKGDLKDDICGNGYSDAAQTLKVFQHLLTLKDMEIARIAAFVMAESLATEDMVDDLGVVFKVAPLDHYKPDAVFFELLRDRTLVSGMLAEVAGKKVADQLVSGKLKDQKAALAKAAAAKPEWCPGLMRFPAAVK